MPDLPCHWDVIVVGGGAAGLMAALELPAGLRVLLLSKESSTPRSASRWAQGGIAAVTRPEDSFASHVADTLLAGGGLCDPSAVAQLVREAPGCVQRLLELGMDFDRNGETLSTTLEAAHSHRRVLHAQDRTGGALVDALERRVMARPGLVRRAGVRALQLLMEGGRCCGLQVLDGPQLRWLRARAVVLATGGGGHLFANTTNPPQASGDGIAMAWRAGAVIRDLEFVQFHPTVMWLGPHARGQQPLVSEAVRGEGAFLVDADGVRFMVGQHELADLAPRDVVAKAIMRRMRQTGAGHVWLDGRGLGADTWVRRFPTILESCRSRGIDPVTDLIPVAPAQHYASGGVRTDTWGRASIPGLYACGEVACTGVHGANRLASNSLLEGLVFAGRIGQAMQVDEVTRRDPVETSARVGLLAHGARRALQQAMDDHAGVLRSQDSLEAASSDLAGLASRDGAYPCTEDWETTNIHAIATVLVHQALLRQETRGSHWREDFPERNDERWRVRLVSSLDERGKLRTRISPLGSPA